MADRSPSDSVRRSHLPRPAASGARPLKPKPKPAVRQAGFSDQAKQAGNSSTPNLSKAVGNIPDFELIREIGRGGSGIVYKARQKSLDRIVAVKILPAARAKDPAILKRFLAEARAAASLRHPNIAAVHQVGDCAAGHFFVMEYVQGTTLQKVLDLRGPNNPVPIARAVEVMITVAQAVRHSHTRDIFHRDLKPSNIIIERPGGRPVVLDFGVAKRMDQFNPTLSAMGTPGYMSPEQAGEAVGSLGKPSDVYALGAILYRLLTGRPPFEAKTPLDTLLLVAGPTTARSVRSLRPEVPERLNDICMKCLSKKPEDRYQSCETLAKDLKAVLKSPDALPAPTTRRPEEQTGPEVVLQLEPSGKRVRLTQPVTLIGRSPDCDLIIKRGDVSARHCRILLNDDGANVEDLESATGITVNGERVKRHSLADGDRLMVAKYPFLVKLRLIQNK
jgi:serine/threonine protein kinase